MPYRFDRYSAAYFLQLRKRSMGDFSFNQLQSINYNETLLNYSQTTPSKRQVLGT